MSSSVLILSSKFSSRFCLDWHWQSVLCLKYLLLKVKGAKTWLLVFLSMLAEPSRAEMLWSVFTFFAHFSSLWIHCQVPRLSLVKSWLPCKQLCHQRKHYVLQRNNSETRIQNSWPNTNIFIKVSPNTILNVFVPSNLTEYKYQIYLFLGAWPNINIE